MFLNIKLDEEIIDGLISIGYDLHVFDIAGRCPDGMDRNEYKQKRIRDLLGPYEKFRRGLGFY